MANFVIAGKPDCPSTVHACFLSRFLEKQLPNFKIKIIQMRTGEWEDWLGNLNWKNQWHISTSPVIWKEIVEYGSKPHLIGGISEFCEYCYDYYGLEYLLSPEEIQQLVDDNMQYFEAMEKKKEIEQLSVRNVLISGISNPMIITLLPEILQVPNLPIGESLKISLYDNYSCKHRQYIKDILDDITPIAGQTVSLVENRLKALINCDLLLIIDDCSRKPNESLLLWCRRNRTQMLILADEINSSGNNKLRVVVACNGPVCFNATILTQACKVLKPTNIVAITSDEGLPYLSVISEKFHISIDQFCAPPIWGFIGINQYVEIDSGLINTGMLLPYQRNVHNNAESTLPQGVIVNELRRISYLTHEIDNLIDKTTIIRNAVIEQLNHQPFYSKVRATISLLKLWYSKTPSDSVISLGIYSTGVFNCPNGIVFSQPVHLVEKVWKPFKDLPRMKETSKIVKELSQQTLEIFNQLDEILPENENFLL